MRSVRPTCRVFKQVTAVDAETQVVVVVGRLILSMMSPLPHAVCQNRLVTFGHSQL